ncbi:probable disease resistance protein At5g66900 [Lotus japonicus]|uniref:probable disease resistance protein At5g66900 n=1 Tax=Lotus japonicus TaxID=34305 RepID=UPI00258C1997|nr:probable disease resistance protein At5g66900 [Lotus japonicus]XP_057416189.1 probable disease resistance protein At5g66900 [Lotus japonicus]
MTMIADALVGELVKELLGAVKDVMIKAVKFKSSLEKLKSTLESLGPDVDKIVEQYRARDRASETKKLVELMKSGKKLVLECSNKFYWLKRLYTKAQYQEKLEELDAKIFRYFQLDMQAKIVRTVLDIEVKVDGISEDLRKAVVTKKESVGLKVCAAPTPPEFTVGFEGPLKDLKHKLLREEVNVSVLPVTGSRGLGKTTLAKMFCWDEQVKGKFKENIFFVTFAKSPNLHTIVQNLFQHNGHPMPEFRSDEDAKNQLENLLKLIGKSGPILLVLDDVYPGSESLVDNFVFQIPNYKILVTSGSAITRFGPPYVLKPLGDEDALKLFCLSASLNQKSTNIPDDVVKMIVKGCRGSPLALSVTGKSLRDQNLVFWRKRAKHLSKGGSILGYEKYVLTCLQESLDNLDHKAIECFKNIGLFPEDQRIPAAALMDIWAELHNEDDETAMEIIYELVNLNMVDIIVTRKVASDIVDYNYHYVTQHGLLRDLAILQTSEETEDKRDRLIIEINRNNLPAWWSLENEYPIAARILSISTDEAFSSELCNLQPTKVEALVLNLRGKKYTLPMFMEKMNKLKVLTITNYDLYPAELENFEMLDHLSNLKRLRLEKVRIPFLSKTGVQLKNLQKCSFFMCNVNEASENCTAQVSNMLPNLVEMDFDYCTMVQLPVVLSDIVLLKNLRITNCHKLSALPEGIEKLVNLESLRLSSCTGLLELPDSITSLQKLEFLDISDCISLSNLPEGMGKLSNLEKLNVKGCSRLMELPASIMELEDLKDVICDEEVVELWEQFKIILGNLRLQVVQVDFTLDFLHNSR